MQLIRLADEGFSIKVFDLSFFMMRNVVRTSYSCSDKRVSVIEIKTRKSLLLILEKYKRKAVVIDYANQDTLIRHMINKLNIKIIRFQCGGIPTRATTTVSTDGVVKNNLFFDALLQFANIKKIFSINAFHVLKRKLFLRVYKPYIDIFILSGEALLINEQVFINESTKVIKAHNYDFDKFKSIESNIEHCTDDLIFIDQMITSHPDLTIKNIKYINPKKYYERLRYFFDKVEDVTGFNVVIALHPRNTFYKDSLDYGGKKVFYGNTAELVKNSRGIITHNSNSVNFAILFEKPILFLADEDLLSMMPELKVIHKWFNQKPIMIDREVNSRDILSNMQFDEDIRETYKKNFIICNYNNQDMSLIDMLIVELHSLSNLSKND